MITAGYRSVRTREQTDYTEKQAGREYEGEAQCETPESVRSQQKAGQSSAAASRTC